MNNFARKLTSILLVITMTGCADMSTRQKGAALGATLGGVAGAVLTNGSALGVVGGAAIGGLIGNNSSSKK